MTSADDLVLQLIEDAGLVNSESIATARAQAESEGAEEVDAKAIDLLVANGYITVQKILETLGNEFGMDVVDLNDIRVSNEALETLPLELAQRFNAFPLEVDGNEIQIAVSDPIDVDTIDSLGHILKMTVNPRLAPAADILASIERYYEGARVSEVDAMFSEMGEGDASVVLPTGEEKDVSAEEAPIIRYVHMVITEAIKRRASDIHLEPLEKRFRVRYRIDGVLQEMENPPKRLQPSIISRLKLMANISIAEKRTPQDGRIQMKSGRKEVDLRVSSLPTVFGESIVMRILDKEGLNLGLPELGFFSDDQATFEKLVAMPDGIFLVTGPTGSGKSTTLYSALNYINHPDRKIITVEDPVEYQMLGINQVQVRRDVGMTFSAALRSMLRQAPNIIMIGEIRDLETAEIAVNASLTGHMVFSTLHTNDAPSAVTRLVDIGVKPFLVSASLRGVMAQRLVRRICRKCSAPFTPDAKDLQLVGIQEDQLGQMSIQKGKGCPTCNGTGYKGRVGIFEIFAINEEMQQMIYESKSVVDLRAKAREGGMRTMREDGIRKVTSGVTSIDEVVSATVGDAL